MSDVIAETVAAISDMRIRGAGRIARAGATALKEYSEMHAKCNPKEFKDDIIRAKDAILASRPTAVSLWNGVNSSIRGLDKTTTFEEARDLVVTNAAYFVKMSSEAVGTIAKIGAKRIKDGDIIMTHCNSSAAIGAIKEARAQGKDIRVYATESRPWRQGILTVNDLSKAGVDTTLIIDSAVRTVMRKTDKVFVGADTIASNGALINKVGTSQLALCAHEARVSFNVCAETYKFSPLTLFGDTVTIEEREIDEVVKSGEIPADVKVFNPVFDTTPPGYIDAIITELGIMSPGSVYDVLVRQLGEDIFN